MNKFIIVGLLVLAVIIGSVLIRPQANEESDLEKPKNLVSVSEITHGHGLAVDVTDSSKVYIATHHGLFLLQNDKDLYQVGDSKDDYMGFSPHPRDSKIFFSSGHLSVGGNIGFQKSEDGGITWKKMSDGVNGPADFHAMAVSPTNPDLILGWYHGTIQRSTDGGKNWEIVNDTNLPIVSLATDPIDENTIYAASPQGLMVSKNQGKEWTTLMEGFVSTIAINPQDSQKLISFSEKLKLAKSNDAGKNWEPVNESFKGETPLHTAFDGQKPEIVYSLTDKNSLYKSADSGTTWIKIR